MAGYAPELGGRVCTGIVIRHCSEFRFDALMRLDLNSEMSEIIPFYF